MNDAREMTLAGIQVDPWRVRFLGTYEVVAEEKLHLIALYAVWQEWVKSEDYATADLLRRRENYCYWAALMDVACLGLGQEHPRA